MSHNARAPRSDMERNRQMLLDAAITVLRITPDASMTEIAEGANLTRPTVYRHFGNRDQLLEAIRAEALTEARLAVSDARLDDGNAIDALSRFISAAIARGDRFQFLLSSGADQEPTFAQQRMNVLAPLRAVVQRGQTSGEIRPELPADWVVSALVALLTAGVRRPDLASEDSSLITATLLKGIVKPSNGTH